LAPEAAYKKIEQQKGDPMRAILAQMAVERGLYKPGVEPYQKTFVEMKKGFDPERYSKAVGKYDPGKEERFEEGFKELEEPLKIDKPKEPIKPELINLNYTKITKLI
jgi:hypothetical protein